MVRTKSGNQVSFRNFEHYCGRSLSPNLEIQISDAPDRKIKKSDMQLPPLETSLVAENVPCDSDRDGLIGGLSLDVEETPTATAASTAAMLSALCIDNLNMFTRAVGSRRASLRQLLGGGEKPQLSVDTGTESVIDSPTRARSVMNIRGQKLLIRSASVSPLKGYSSSATNVRRVNFFPGDVNVLRRGVSGSDIPLNIGSISEKVGPSTFHPRSSLTLGVTSEKVKSTNFKKVGKPGSFGTTLSALPPELRGTFSSERLEEPKHRIYPSGSRSAAKSSSLAATAKPVRCRSIDAIVPKSSEKISSSSKILIPKISEKVLAKNLLAPLSSTVQPM